MSNLKQGDMALLVKYRYGLDLCYRQKLLSYGLLPGIRFKVARIAPLGDPVELFFNDVTISIRRFELNMAVIRKLSK